ncbi:MULTISPECIES: glycosyltransferase [unclassified Sinorhizobium]|uniref:CgeB family protein n=1 Tax=unclassified Sinorhizobium TaxID=2613772 RepID=UPI003524408D
MTGSLDIVIIGLSLSSSWGNGHATTFRALVRGLHEEGHRVLFLERDVPWYANHRDLKDPDFCELAYFQDTEELFSRFCEPLRSADAVIIGSYVPDGIAIVDRLCVVGPRLLCFYDIDTPVTLARLARGDEEYLAVRQIPLFDIYFSFSGGDVLDRLERHYGARRAMPLYCAVDAERYRCTQEAPQWDLGYLGTYSEDRQQTLEELLIEPARQLRQMRFVVAGPGYPDEIEWPANVDRIDHIAPGQHASFYSRQRFTLNVTRSDMRAAGWSPSVRLFEAAACRTPVISDEWQGLSSLFPEEQAIVIARESADVVEALVQYGPEKRRLLSEIAYDIVAGAHTGRFRARELAAALETAAQEAADQWLKTV